MAKPYESALWYVANPPDCLSGEDVSIRAVIIAHNKEIGELQAIHDMEYDMQQHILDNLRKENRYLKNALELKNKLK